MNRSTKVKLALGRFLVLLFIVSFLGPFAVPVEASSATSNGPADSLLQFTSSGHMLGFNRGGVIIVSNDHMLETEFLQSNPVFPLADNAASNENGYTGAPVLSRVTYYNLWDGINLVYSSAEGMIVKSTYYLDSPSETSRIQLGYNRPVCLDSEGNLVISYERGTLQESAPVAWQEIAGEKRTVAAAFILYGEREVGFVLDDYLPGIPVVIDPDTTWNTFLGGTQTDQGYGIAVDSSGNVYVCGESSGTWQGTSAPKRTYTEGNLDAFAAKLDRNGNLIWNTFLGGNGEDIGRGIAVDSSGNVYVCGESTVTWQGTEAPMRAFSGTSSTTRDAFAAKLDSSGNLTWNTFLGGYNTDNGYGIGVDSSGNVYACGYGQSASWPGMTSKRDYYGGIYEAFAAKMDAQGNLIWYTLLGGYTVDLCYGIAVESKGNVFVCGYSNGVWQGTSAPGRPYSGGGPQDAFAAKLDSDGNLIWHSFLGGTLSDFAYGIAVDSSGNVYACGYSNSTWGSPIRTWSAFFDAFAAKLDGNNGNLVWNTFLGGIFSDQGRGIAVDGSGNVFVSGQSNGTWEGTSAPKRAYSDSGDAFAAKLESDGDLSWNTFLGGASSDLGKGVAADVSGNVYVCGYSDYTWQGVVPPVRAHSSDLVDFYYDAFAAKVNSNGEFVLPSPEVNLKAGTDNISSGGNYNFGTRTINSDTEATFTIENQGNADLTITTPLTLDGPDASQFSLTKQPVSPVTAGGETTFIVSFNPVSAGIKTASITILDNDTDESIYTLNLTVNAIPVMGVGGEVKGPNKLDILVPWILLGVILTVCVVIPVLKRRGCTWYKSGKNRHESK
jgi:hypothetical protein